MKCFSIDLDGTLLDSKHQIPHENYKVLQELQSQGHTIIINTGRAVEDVLKFAEIQGLQPAIISMNGTIIYSKTRDILFEATLPDSTYKELLQILQKLGLWVMIYTNQGGFPCRNPDIQDKTPEDISSIFEDYNYDHILEKENLKIYKIMAVSRHDELEKIQRVKKTIDGNIEVSMASSHPNNVEFTSVKANKGTAILRYQKLMNFQFEEIFTFGDGENDLEQFKAATTSIAMENAPFHIKQEADMITKSNDENGFAYAVHHMINL